jgi:thiamine-phosphate pyrophosphorylase
MRAIKDVATKARRVDHRLYGIIDPAQVAVDPLSLVEDALNGGLTLLQVRDKRADARAALRFAQAVVKRVGGRVPVLINDRVDLALATEADGVHLGRDDLPPDVARRLLGPSAIIGITIKDETDLVWLDADVVDYGTIGGVFATSSKVNADAPLGLEAFARLRQAAAGLTALPVGAIAGIGKENAADVIAAGADGIAVISALFRQPDVTEAARVLRRTVDDAVALRRRSLP